MFLLMHLRMTGVLLLDPPPTRPTSACASSSTPARTRSASATRGASGRARSRSAPRRATRSSPPASASSRSPTSSPGGAAGAWRAAGARRSRRSCSTSAGSPASGNIYADEALFRARIHPLRPAGALKRAQYDALAVAVRETLLAGLAAGGATIDDFRHADGVSGAFQNEFLVHRRRGRGLPGVRRRDRQVRRRGARDVRVRALPAAAARAAVAASWSSSARLTSRPPPKPVSEPSAPTRRWHGRTIGSGLRPFAAPTARAARGAPSARACSP